MEDTMGSMGDGRKLRGRQTAAESALCYSTASVNSRSDAWWREDAEWNWEDDSDGHKAGQCFNWNRSQDAADERVAGQAEEDSEWEKWGNWQSDGTYKVVEEARVEEVTETTSAATRGEPPSGDLQLVAPGGGDPGNGSKPNFSHGDLVPRGGVIFGAV